MRTILGSALLALWTVAGLAQTTITTINVDWNNPGGGLCAFFTGQHNAAFTDTAGSNWTYLKIRIPLAVIRTESGPGPAAPSTVTVSINGVQVGNPVLVANQAFVCGPLQVYEFGATSLPAYRPFASNTLTVTSSGGAAGNAGEPAELMFMTEPRTFTFEIPPALSQRMLIHKSGTNDSYPSPWQVPTTDAERPRFRFRGAVSSRTGASREADVWFRVHDPADPSRYLPSGQSGIDDNEDPMPYGTLMTPNCTDPSCRASGSILIRSSAGGGAEVWLEGTDRYAGDNYVIEASFDPQFSCGTAGANGTNICARSGTLTAWKRVYVDRMRMLRNGMPIVGTFVPGSTSITVRGNRYGGNHPHDRLSRGDEIILVHAPAADRSDVSDGWYAEPHNILAVTDNDDGTYTIDLGFRERGQVWQEVLQHQFRDDPFNNDLGDAIARIDGLTLTPDDVFDASTDLVTNGPFQEAYTEYVFLNTPASAVPLPRFFATERVLQSFVEKWSSVVVSTGGGFAAPPNHQLLVVAAAGDGAAAGVTISQVTGKTSSFVFRETINREAGNRGLNADRWAMKTMAHEIAHQWWTNGFLWGPNSFDHCPPDTRTFEPSSMIYCLLADATATGSETQRANGIARFHMLPDPRGGWHSEYFEIRRRPDPFTP